MNPLTAFFAVAMTPVADAYPVADQVMSDHVMVTCPAAPVPPAWLKLVAEPPPDAPPPGAVPFAPGLEVPAPDAPATPPPAPGRAPGGAAGVPACPGRAR